MATTLVNLSDELADLAADVRRSLVRIRNGRQGEGTGSVWHPDGLIVTNAHVVGSDNLRVTLADGRDLPARVLARSAEHDLAALAVEADDLTSISLGQSEHLRAGQLVLAMGHPWGVSDAVTSGAVIGVGPGLPETPAAGRDWIAAGLRLRPGNSGGPMMDDQGRLVGINTMMTGPSVAIAVPVHSVKRFLQEALQAESAPA